MESVLYQDSPCLPITMTVPVMVGEEQCQLRCRMENISMANYESTVSIESNKVN